MGNKGKRFAKYLFVLTFPCSPCCYPCGGTKGNMGNSPDLLGERGESG
jgi:hypothetical protein